MSEGSGRGKASSKGGYEIAARSGSPHWPRGGTNVVAVSAIGAAPKGPADMGTRVTLEEGVPMNEGWHQGLTTPKTDNTKKIAMGGRKN